MSITSPDDRISTYEPVVATNEFAAQFPVFDNDDIKVFVDGEERDDFAVSATYAEGISNDAKAVFAVGVTGTVQVVGVREPRRTNRFKDGAPLPTRDQNLALDTLEAEVQEARRDMGRAAKSAYGEFGPAIPPRDTGRFLRWNADGDLENASPDFSVSADTRLFDTVADAAGADIPGGVKWLHTGGFSNADDGRSVQYAKTTGAVTPGEITSGDGARWRLAAKIVEPVTLTVGPGGQFATIADAIFVLSHMRGSAYAPGGVEVKILLLNGFVVQEQIWVEKIDLGWVTIESEAPEVVISRQSLTTLLDGYYPTFFASNGGRLPVINALFNMDTSGNSEFDGAAGRRNGIAIFGAGSKALVLPGAGVKNASARGAHLANGGSVTARYSVFSGAGEAAMRLSNGSNAEVRWADLTNSHKGLMINTAFIDAQSADCSNCDYGIEAYDCFIRFEEGIANNCSLNAVLFHGGYLSGRRMTANDCAGVATEIREGATANLRSANIKGAGSHAVLVSNSRATVTAGDLSDADGTAVYAIGGSVVGAASANLTQSGQYAVYAEGKSSVDAQSALGASTKPGHIAGYFNQYGSDINANLATGTLGRSQNSLSRHGIIYAAP